MCAYAYVYAYVYVYVYVRVLVSVRLNVCVWLKQAFAAENIRLVTVIWKAEFDERLYKDVLRVGGVITM